MTKSSTPTLPEFILNYDGLKVPSRNDGADVEWVNAFSPKYLGPGVRHLYATETLFGDWDAEILLLAQDALPAAALTSLINSNLSNGLTRESAWRHADRVKFGDKKGWKTNKTIKDLMDKYAPQEKALYGSAAAHMLYSDGGLNYRQNLLGFKHPLLTAYLVRVLNWVVKNMPNLKLIMCLGEHAWRISNEAAKTGEAKKFVQYRDDSQALDVMIEGRRVSLVPAFHPMAIKALDEKERPWKVLSEVLSKYRTI